MNEQNLSLTEFHLEDGGVEGGQEHLRNRACVMFAHAIRHRQDGRPVCRYVFRVSASAQETHHPIPDLPPFRVGAQSLDNSREFQPEDVLRPPLRSGVHTAQLQQVGTVDARGRDACQDFTGARDRLGYFL